MVRESLICSLPRAVAALLAIAAFSSCTTLEVATTATGYVCAPHDHSANCPPPAPREFRAVWVATVANIDWPTKPGLSAEEQRNEVLAILNRLQALNMNAVILQVRPGADAIYPSKLEPWAEWITGEQGKSPGYDPLKFWIDEARNRGIEVHAWFNPYRARHTKAVSPPSSEHVAKRMPSSVKSYGGFLWLDPADRTAQDHSYNVIMDVLRRYDIDGVHFDDYFYPYPVTEQTTSSQTAGQNAIANALNSQGAPAGAGAGSQTRPREVDFPDDSSWNAYLSSGGKLSRADWRRDNVNRFVERVYRGVKSEKPWVRFGISPFGIGRPDRRPAGITGFSQYDKLYADVELWLQQGWLDYLAPQLYWPIDQAPQAFPVLLDYWHSQNSLKREIYPGLYTSRIEETPRGWQPKEIENQIALVRSKREVSQGHIHFSAAAIMQQRRGIDSALAGLYSAPAIPTYAILSKGNTQENNTIEIKENVAQFEANVGIRLQRSKPPMAEPISDGGFIALWLRYGASWQFGILPLAMSNSSDPSDATVPRATKDGPLNAVSVSLIDRFGRESNRTLRRWTP